SVEHHLEGNLYEAVFDIECCEYWLVREWGMNELEKQLALSIAGGAQRERAVMPVVPWNAVNPGPVKLTRYTGIAAGCGACYEQQGQGKQRKHCLLMLWCK